MATYLAVGDDGRILCSGSQCSGTQNSGTTKHLNGVAKSSFQFSNGVRLRFAVGDDGVIRRMRANGKWRKMPSDTTRDLNDVTIAPGTKIAWAVGDEGTILKTTNAGVAWGVQTSHTDLHLKAVHAVDENIVWAAGDHAHVFRTIDGGRTWKRVHWGGASVGELPFDIPSITSKHLRAIVAVNDKRALAVGDDGAYIGTIDGGTTWEGDDGGLDLNGIALAKNGRIFVVGDDGLIMIGRNFSFTNPHWKVRNSGTSKNLNAVAVNGSRVIAVGDDGDIRISKDAGASWIEASRGSKSLRAVV